MTQPVNPPDAWTPISGLWGTDFQRDDSQFLTTGTSLKIVGTAAQAQTLYGDWFPIDANGVAYDVTAVVRATNNTSLFTLKLVVYNADRSTVAATIYLYNNQAAPTANAWLTSSQELQTTTGYSWARWEFTRASGATSSIYIDRLEVKKLGPRWHVRQTGSDGIDLPSTASYQLSFSTTDYVSLTTIVSSTYARIYRAGVYLLKLQALISTLRSTDLAKAYFKVGSTNISPTTYTPYLSGVGVYTIDINHVTTYRHPGTIGAGTDICAYIDFTKGAGSAVNAFISDAGSDEWTADTTFSGMWLGLG